jgi:hypothetical protein
MKLHTAGISEPQNPALIDAGAPSGLPSRHGINITGTSCRWSLRNFAESITFGVRSSRLSPKEGFGAFRYGVALVR